MGDHRIDLDQPLHVPIHDARRVGAAARSTERGTAPNASGHQLKRSGRDLCARRRHADDYAFAPTAMACLEGLTHHRDVAGAVERVVRAATRQLDEIGHEIAGYFLRIDEVRHAEAPAPLFFVVVDVDAHDHLGPDQLQSLNHVEPDAAETEDDG